MAAQHVDAPYILLVHTDSYAGNFERELCAYMTGVVGECGVGDDEAEIFREDMEELGKDPDMFEDRLSQEADDHGTCRPASIWCAEGETGYKTVAIFFDDLPTADETVLLRERAYEYCNDNKIVVEKLSLIKRTVTVREVVISELSDPNSSETTTL